jgi:hypothetical protein
MTRDNEKIIEILVSTKRCLREKLAALAMAEASTQTLRGFTEVMLIVESISENIGEGIGMSGVMSGNPHGQLLGRADYVRGETLQAESLDIEGAIVKMLEPLSSRLDKLLERVDRFEESRVGSLQTLPRQLTNIQLHKCLDSLVAGFTEDYPNRDATKAPLWDLIKWSSDRAQIPTEEPDNG